MRRAAYTLTLLLLALAAPTTWLACGGGDGASADTSGPGDDTDVGGVPTDTTTADTVDAGPTVPHCTIDKLPQQPYVAGSSGVHRNEVSAGFTLPLTDGTSWRLGDHFDGCSVYVLLTDSLVASPVDATPAWDDDDDVGALLDASPDNVHYFFVSNSADAALVPERMAALTTRLTALLEARGASAVTRWQPRLHVVAAPAADLDPWLATAFTGPFVDGLVVDRGQRLRGIGALADVARPDGPLRAAGQWPWRNNIAYVAHEAVHANADYGRTRALAAREEAVVTLFDGEILSGEAEVDVELPSNIGTFASLHVDLTLACPDPDAPELADNCGAWDYLASLTVRDDEADGGPVEREIARVVTSYHRESHLIVDASAALPLLASGGSRHFRWNFAPTWNPQPTATRLRLVLGDHESTARPRHLFPLFTGGTFGSSYNATREPLDLDIPATATRVELWVWTTGHGAGTAQCAEFCGHQHRFEVNGHAHFQTFPEAGSETGCLDALSRGVTPNQAGTWWYGRGGWCPGAAVAPWVVDVTSEVTPGNPARITYRGLFAGGEPPDGAGEIVLTSYLVVWE